jgi:hypothetical protein
MTLNIFYSWQDDAPRPVCRNFIERALRKALNILKSDAEIEEAVRDGLKLDKDTSDVGGHAPIVDTIFKKIDAAAVFVPDLTYVANRINSGRPSPNPNVLIEYGWALRSRGWQSIVPVMNTAFGSPDERPLPFDMRHLRHPIAYHLSEDNDETQKSAELQKLANDLAGAIRLVLKDRQPDPPPLIPKFPAKTALDGRARFRARGESLGYGLAGNPTEPVREFGLVPGPAIWLRVMPTSSIGRSWEPLELRQLLGGVAFLTVCYHIQGSMGLINLRGDDGYGISPATGVHLANKLVGSLAYIFETGEIWSIDTLLLAHANSMPIADMKLYESLESYGNILWSKFAVEGDLHWIAGVEGVKGRSANAARSLFPNQHPCTADVIEADGTYSRGQSAYDAIEPFMQKIRSKCGLP